MIKKKKFLNPRNNKLYIFFFFPFFSFSFFLLLCIKNLKVYFKLYFINYDQFEKSI